MNIKEGYLYQEYEPTPNNPCEIKFKNLEGLNLLGKVGVCEMKENINNLLEKLKDSIECPIITFPSCDGSDEEQIDNDTYLTPEDCKTLLDYITQLESNWKELKKWLEEEHREDAIVINLTWKHATGEVLNKMQELENTDVNNK